MHYQITLEDKGPFDLPNIDLQDFISNVTHFQLKYHIESVIPTTNIGIFEWYLWEINTKVITVIPFVIPQNCEALINFYGEKDNWQIFVEIFSRGETKESITVFIFLSILNINLIHRFKK